MKGGVSGEASVDDSLDTGIGGQADVGGAVEHEHRRPQMLVLSHVWPFPGSAGQEQRVLQTLFALRTSFHVTFLTFATDGAQVELRKKLMNICDDVLIMPSVYNASLFHRLWHHVAGTIYALFTGLKSSNYSIGKVEFSPGRVAKMLGSRSFDLALFEYWHAESTVPYLRDKGILCVLDMHDILWQGRLQRFE